MTTRMFQVDGVDVTLETRAFRQIVYWNHERVSEISTLRPSLTVSHRFTTADPIRHIEVQVYQPGPGWIVMSDGNMVSREPPAKWLGVLWLFIWAVSFIDFLSEPSVREGVMAVLAAVTTVLFLLPRWLWNRTVRRLTPNATV